MLHPQEQHRYPDKEEPQNRCIYWFSLGYLGLLLRHYFIVHSFTQFHSFVSFTRSNFSLCREEIYPVEVQASTYIHTYMWW